MISSLSKFESLNEDSVEAIKTEIEYLKDTLEVLRATNEISNDAFLQTGSIQGDLSMILNLLSQGIDNEEASTQMAMLMDRARTLENSFPGLDSIIESKR